jgi:hypothetical protein
MYRKNLIMAIALGLLSATVWGQTNYEKSEGNDEYAARMADLVFRSVILNPRLDSLAGAYVAHSTGADALAGNPAGLDGIDGIELELFGGFQQLSGDMTYNGNLGYPDGGRIDPAGDADGDFYHGSLGVAIPVEEYFTLGAGVQFLSSDNEEDDLMDWDHDVAQGFLSISKKVSDSVALGYRIAYINLDLDGDSHGKIKSNNVVIPLNEFTTRDSKIDWDSTFDHTLGIQWKAADRWRLGAEVGYLHGNFDIDTTTQVFDVVSNLGMDGDLERYRLRGGAAVDLSERTLLALDLEYQTSERDYDPYLNPSDGMVRGAKEDLDEFSMHLGAEHRLYDWLALRGGVSYTWLDYEDDFAARPYDLNLDYPGVFGGFGIFYKQIEVSCSLGYENEGDGDWNTSAGVTVRF